MGAVICLVLVIGALVGLGKVSKIRGLEDNPEIPIILRIVCWVSLIAGISMFLFNTFGTIKAGERGILLQFNAVTGRVFGEGLFVKIPFVQDVQKIDVKIQKEQTEADAASKDLQTVKSIIALNFHLQPEGVNKIWQEVGAEYKTRIIDPAIQETVKACTAKLTAEELITKREIVREDIKALLKEKLSVHGIIVDEFNIVNFDFSPTFNAAIEAKVTAEQQALAAKNKLEQVKFEAQQAIESAQGKAKAIQIEGEALKTSPQVVELRWIEKWNGIVPLYWGNATPFIGLENKQ
jgi:regulator of protease activity HflC (stomatin/prohibitin superfamily)